MPLGPQGAERLRAAVAEHGDGHVQHVPCRQRRRWALAGQQQQPDRGPDGQRRQAADGNDVQAVGVRQRLTARGAHAG